VSEKSQPPALAAAKRGQEGQGILLFPIHDILFTPDTDLRVIRKS
jgi:hypothetical protein